MNWTGLCLILACLFVGSLLAQNWQIRTTLLTDASMSESSLWVREAEAVQVDQDILLETRDGSFSRSYRVRHVFDDHILIEGRLVENWTAGTKIYQ